MRRTNQTGAQRLTLDAFLDVFGRKQAGFGGFVGWLTAERAERKGGAVSRRDRQLLLHVGRGR